MNSTALKRWLVLGGLLGLTLYLVWNSPRPEIQSTGMAALNRGAADVTALHVASRPAEANAEFHFAPRVPAADEVVDLFAPVVAKRPPIQVRPIVREVAPVPQAPPLPFTFVGKITEADGVKIFLQANNVLYSGKVGDTFAQQYQLVQVENGKLSLLYLPLNITQTISYGEAP